MQKKIETTDGTMCVCRNVFTSIDIQHNNKSTELMTRETQQKQPLHCAAKMKDDTVSTQMMYPNT